MNYPVSEKVLNRKKVLLKRIFPSNTGNTLSSFNG